MFRKYFTRLQTLVRSVVFHRRFVPFWLKLRGGDFVCPASPIPTQHEYALRRRACHTSPSSRTPRRKCGTHTPRRTRRRGSVRVISHASRAREASIGCTAGGRWTFWAVQLRAGVRIRPQSQLRAARSSATGAEGDPPIGNRAQPRASVLRLTCGPQVRSHRFARRDRYSKGDPESDSDQD